VRIPDPHLEVGTIAGFEHDQLVAADARAPVGDRLGKRRRDVKRLFASVDEHEIVAETMHLVEVPPHWPRLRERPAPSPHVREGPMTMQRAANDVMQSVIFSAVLDAVAALKRASGGLPNQLLRDVQAIHPNVTFADLPEELQDQIVETTRAAFTQLLKEGYAVGPRQQMQQSRPMDRVPDRQRPDRRGPPRGPATGHRRGGRPPKGG